MIRGWLNLNPNPDPNPNPNPNPGQGDPWLGGDRRRYACGPLPQDLPITYHLPPTTVDPHTYHLPPTSCRHARGQEGLGLANPNPNPNLTLTLTLTLAGMEVGKKVIVKIPPEYAYGKKVS